jgi:hypothetical protein
MSILGLMLYAIFILPLFDIMPVLSFADDSYNVESNSNKVDLANNMEKSLEVITKWQKMSGW